ncbi:BTB/POZ protein [Lophiotrema nucula]|uniref:BTB/POZ protein n=1 Tax=Lophiotrema nucula TaxID=690887 RepID=A0A6A5ZTZ4_9PLEO|nr:BTB/POZ protein [Lophiotrema nucula]
MADSQPAALNTLFNDPTFSDITIRQICDGKVKEYPAHKAVLCNHSNWFKKALTGQFKEASHPTIEVHDDNPNRFAIMLEHLYTLQYSNKDSSYTVHSGCLVPIGVYALADKYDIPTLKALAAQEFGKNSPSLIMTSDVEQIVKSHYQHLIEVNGELGKVITAFLVAKRSSCNWMSTHFIKLVKEYPNFGADMALYAYLHGTKSWK